MSFLVRNSSSRWSQSGGGLGGRSFVSYKRRESLGELPLWARCCSGACLPALFPAWRLALFMLCYLSCWCTWHAVCIVGGTTSPPDDASGYLLEEVREARAGVAALDRYLFKVKSFKELSFELVEQAHLAMSRLEQVRGKL